MIRCKRVPTLQQTMRCCAAGIALLAAAMGQARELTFGGALGNSGGSGETLVEFAGQPAPGMGPVVDEQQTIWERGGSRQLNRYALDGRMLASFAIPESTDRSDQLTQAGNFLLLKLRKSVYAMPLNAPAGAMPEKLLDNTDTMSSSAFQGRVVVFDKDEDQLRWLDPATGEQTAIVKPGIDIHALCVDDSGTVYAFGGGKVNAWNGGKLVADFPKEFHGERPRKIGKFWYSHGWHGTVHRMNERFEPAPGVVLGGASGSFIGYLPQSVDVTNGRGLVHVAGDTYAISGLSGVVQLLTWNSDELRFDLARRIGALPKLTGVALDTAGNIWTPYGSWRWSASCEAPLTLGDKEPDVHAQPTILGGRTLCLLKQHYSYVQLAHGRLIDSSGWSHLDNRGVQDFELPQTVSGAAIIPHGDGQALLVVTRGGDTFQIGITDQGRQRSKPAAVEIPGLSDCTSLAWFDGRLYAADRGAVIGFAHDGESGWKQTDQLAKYDGEAYIHSDGRRLAVSDTAGGGVHVFDSALAVVARYAGLKSPTLVAIAGDRAVVYESQRQRLVKLSLESAAESTRLTARPAPPVEGKFAAPDEADFQDLSRPGGIPLAVALTTDARGLIVSLRTQTDPLPVIEVGVANAKQALLLSSADARTADGQFHFRVPDGDWSSLRLAVRIALSDQQERFGFVDQRAIHAPFSPDPADWAKFDLENYRELVEQRRQEIRLTFEQPSDGKTTLVIEDAGGHRIRNLVSGRSFTAGSHTVVWDGFDEQGRLVAPGEYRWRGIAHAGVEPIYRMNFANGGEATVASWGPNHSTLQAAAANGSRVFFAAPVTEGGWALMALDADGNFVQGYDHLHGYGIGHDEITADEQYLYCAQDGFIWGGAKGVDLASDSWTAEWKLTLVRYDIASGRLVEFPGKRRAIVVDTMQVGPGSNHPDLKEYNLGGLAVRDGKLYVGSRNRQAVLVLDAETGEELESIALPGVRRLAAGDEIYAATDGGVVRLRDGKCLITADELDLAGIAVAPNGDILVSDRRSHQVAHFTAEGKPVDKIGVPGGPYKGAYDPRRMVHPAGLVFGPQGKLWVTEQRWNPKRVLAWDLVKNDVVYEKFGMPHYGGDGSGFDPENPRRWIGLGCFWDVDIEQGTARPTHILSLEEGHFGNYEPHSYVFFREAGRTFVCARGKISLISEVLPDGTLHDLVATAGTHHFAYGCGWDPPQAYIDAFYAQWPEKRAAEKPGRKGEGKPWSQRGMGVLWVDRNGDGKAQREEFDFCGDDIAYGGGAWGHLQTGLTLYMPVERDGQVKIVAIAPQGFLKNGVPDYPTLDAALAQATPIDLTPGYKRSGVATVRDRFGRFIFNSDPEMNAYADGQHRWSYANQWSDVHGSHKAPLPEPGVMQGALGILGIAPLDEASDVFFLNGNHGRCFLMSSDGLYLDEAFVDVRVSYLKNEYRLGGEIFGGSFGRSNVDGKYYVQIGHGPYRIYELAGLGEIRRMGGTLTVSKGQVLAAERNRLRRDAEQQVARQTSIPGTIRWDKSGKFRVELDLAVDASHLRLHYRVQDNSPWVNNGRDWTKLFATGDSVDVQFGADPNAATNRKNPAPGDKRLLIAPLNGEPIAVLYEHRKPNGTNPIEFTSPWRGEKVDHVQRLTDAQVEVKTNRNGYEVVVAVPLGSLGLEYKPGTTHQADFGVTYGDAEGTDTNLRSYWSNQSTGLVDDIPGEIMLSPNLWGEITFGQKPAEQTAGDD